MPFKIQYKREFFIKFLYYWVTGFILFSIIFFTLEVFALITCIITVASITCAIFDLESQESFLEKVYKKLYLERIKDFAKNIFFYIIIGLISFSSLKLSLNLSNFSIFNFFVFSSFMALTTLCASIHTISKISLKDEKKFERIKFFFKKMLHYVMIGAISSNVPLILFPLVFGFPTILFAAIFCSSVDAIMQKDLKEPIFTERYFILLFSFIGLVTLFLIIFLKWIP